MMRGCAAGVLANWVTVVERGTSSRASGWRRIRGSSPPWGTSRRHRRHRHHQRFSFSRRLCLCLCPCPCLFPCLCPYLCHPCLCRPCLCPCPCRAQGSLSTCSPCSHL